MKCSLSNETIEALRVHVIKDIIGRPSDSFNLKESIKSIYQLVLDTTDDNTKALDAARLVPLFIKQVEPFNNKVEQTIIDSKVDLNELTKLKNSFINEDTGLEVIQEYLMPPTNKAEKINKLNAERKPQLGPGKKSRKKAKTLTEAGILSIERELKELTKKKVKSEEEKERIKKLKKDLKKLQTEKPSSKKSILSKTGYKVGAYTVYFDENVSGISVINTRTGKPVTERKRQEIAEKYTLKLGIINAFLLNNNIDLKSKDIDQAFEILDAYQAAKLEEVSLKEESGEVNEEQIAQAIGKTKFDPDQLEAEYLGISKKWLKKGGRELDTWVLEEFIPMYPGLEREDTDTLIQAVKKFISTYESVKDFEENKKGQSESDNLSYEFEELTGLALTPNTINKLRDALIKRNEKDAQEAIREGQQQEVEEKAEALKRKKQPTQPASEVALTSETVTDKKGRTYTYFENTKTKGGTIKTTYTFNRSDKDTSQRNTAGVKPEIALDNKGYKVTEDSIPSGTTVNKVYETRIDENDPNLADATVEFINENGDTFKGEVQLEQIQPAQTSEIEVEVVTNIKEQGPIKLFKNSLQDVFEAIAPTFFATTGQETAYIDKAGNKRGEGGVRIRDEKTKLQYAVQRYILEKIIRSSGLDGSDIQIGDVKGVYLTAMSVANPNIEIPSRLDMSKDPQRNGVLLVVTNKLGEPIRFDETKIGKIYTDGVSGTQIVFSFPNTDSIEKESAWQVQQRAVAFARMTYNTKKPTDEQIAISAQQLMNEVNGIKRVREVVRQNKTSAAVRLKIIGGSLGYIEEDNRDRRKLQGIDTTGMTLHLGTDVDQAASRNNTTTKYREGFPYIRYNKGNKTFDELYNTMLVLERPTIKQSGHAETLKSLLFDDLKTSYGEPISFEQRRNLIRQFINPSNRDTEFVQILKDETDSEHQKYSLFIKNWENGELVEVNFSDPNSIAEGKAEFDKLVNTARKQDKSYNQFKMNIVKQAIEENIIKVPSIENGIISYESMLYMDFIKASNFMINTRDVGEDNKLRRTNSYLTFAIDPITEETPIEKEEKQNEKIEENNEILNNQADEIDEEDLGDDLPDIDIVEYNDDDPDLKLNFDIKSRDIKATKKQIKEAQEWYENHPMKKYIPYKEMFNVINSEAAAGWSRNGITLFKGSDYADLYHEAFHGFSQTFLTKKQKEDLYNEVRKKEGYFKDYKGELVTFTSANNKQIEEYLASEFRNYMLKGQKPTKGSPKQNSFFRRIWNALKALFSSSSVSGIIANQNSDAVIHELFEKLRVGNLKEYTFDQRNSMFSGLATGIVASKDIEEGGVSELNYSESKEIVDMIDRFISEEIANQNSNLDEFERKRKNELLNQLAILKKDKNASQKEINDINIELKAFENRSSHQYTGQITKNKKLLMKAYRHSYARLFEISQGLYKDFKKEKNPIKKVRIKNDYMMLKFALENFGDLNDLNANKPIGNDVPKDVIAYHMHKSKVFLDGQDAVEEVQDGSDDVFIKARQAFDRGGNETSLRELANAEILYLIKTLPKLIKDENGNWVEKTNRFGVVELNDFVPTWNRLVRGLENVSSFDEMVKRLEVLAIEYPPINGLIQRMGLPKNSKSNNEHSLWTNFWQTFNKSRIPLIQMTVTGKKLNEKDEHSETIWNVKTGKAFTAEEAIGKGWQDKFTGAAPFSDPYITHSDTGNYLNTEKLLEDFTLSDAMNYPFEFYNAIGFKLSDNEDLKIELERGMLSGRFNPRYFYEAIEEIHNDEKGTKIKSFKQFTERQNTRYKALMLLEANYSDVFSSFMVSNAEGNTEFEHSLNNSMTMTVNTMNDAENYFDLISQPHMSHLNIENNPFTKASVWMRSMFDLMGSNDPTKDNYNPNYGNRRYYKDEPIKLKINNLSGVYLEDDSSEGDGTSSAGADEYTKLILDLHLSNAGFPEVMRHADKSTSFSLTLTGPVLDSGGKTGSGYINIKEFVGTDYKGRALDLLTPHIMAEVTRYKRLKDINDDPNATNYDFDYVKKSIQPGKEFYAFKDVLNPGLRKKLIDKVNNGESLEEIQEFLSTTAQQEINQDFNKYFEKQYQDTKAKFDEAAFVGNNIIEELVKKEGIPKHMAKEAMLRSFVYNSWIHNLESTAVLYGDLAQYNEIKEGFHKRNAGAGSTGTIYRTDQIIKDHINNNLWEGSYSASLGIKKHDFTGQLHTGIIEDMSVKSVYFDELNEVLSKAGKKPGEYEGKMNEADAQGLINFDAYRQLKIAEGTWTPEHTKLYNDIVEGKDVDSTKVITFFPVIKGQYWGPIATKEGQLPIQAFHKYSLFPMIPTVIKGKKMEAIHKKMLEENIGYITFESGSKVGNITRTKDSGFDKIYNSPNGVDRTLKPEFLEETTAESPEIFTKNTIFLQYFKNQLEIHDEHKGSVIFSTQLRKLIEDGLVENGVPIDFMPLADAGVRKTEWEKLGKYNQRGELKDDSKMLDASDYYKLLKTYESHIDELSKLAKDKLLKEINWTSEIKNGEEVLTGNINNLLVLVKKELDRQDLGEHALDFIDKNGNPKYDLSLSLHVEKIEKLLNALMVKRLVKQKVNGEGLIQVASTLMEELNSDSKWTNATAEDIKKYKGSNDLPSYHQGAGIKMKTAKDKVNIYAGTGENAELSNFAERTYTDPLGIEFKNVEAGFQYAKLSRATPTTAADRAVNDKIAMDLQSATGAQAKALGRKIKGLDVAAWDKDSSSIMKSIIKDSFLQNDTAAQALMLTGSATLTHTQDKTKWGKEFPKLLMEVRSELAKDSKWVKFIEERSSNNTTAMKVKVALAGDFKKLAHAIHLDGKKMQGKTNEETLKRLNESIRNEEWLNTGRNREMLTMVGVRIPVQGMNSMEFMEVYEFLPAEAGSIIIPPTEIVTKSGADFDVDKMTVMMPNIGIVDGVPELYNSGVKITGTKKELEARADEVNEKLDAIHESFKEKDYLFTEEEQEILKTRRKEYAELTKELRKLEKEWADLYGRYKSPGVAAKLMDLEDQINAKKIERVNHRDSTGQTYFGTFKDMKKDPLHKELTQIRRELNELSSKSLQNKIIIDIKKILELPHNFVPLVTPNTTDYFTENLPGQNKSLAEKGKKYTAYNPSHQLLPEYGQTEAKDVEKGINPTRTLEIGYNLYKHTSNAVGKETLGLGAVDNTYNTLFNRIGAYLNPTNYSRKEYEELEKKVNAKKANQIEINKYNSFVEQKILLPSNTIKINGEDAISLSHIKSAKVNKNEKDVNISDVVNQLINGWVDIAAGTWVFDVQGNKELSPTLLFMIQAGIPTEHAVYLISNPIIREYVKQMKLAKSTFAKPLNKGNGNPDWYQSAARTAIMTDPRFGFGLGADPKKHEIFGKVKSILGKSKLAIDFTDKDALEKRAESSTITEEDREIFAHFLQLEEMAKPVKNIKMRTNVDTSRDASLFEAQGRLGMLAEIREDGRIPESLVNKIMKESPIGSFFIQDFQIKLLGGLFPLRNNKTLNEYALAMDKDIVDNTYGDKDITVANWKSDLISFVFQNELNYYDINKETHYNSRVLDTNYDSKEAILKGGAYVDGNVIYIDKAAIKKQFLNSEYANIKYRNNYGFETVDKKAFGNDKTTSGEQQYFRFVLERESLRAQTPLSKLKDSIKFKDLLKRLKKSLKQREDETEVDYNKRIIKRGYEIYLRDQALTNTHNHFQLFESKNTFAHEFYRIKNDYPELAVQYPMLMNGLSMRVGLKDEESTSDAMKNLALNNSSLEGDDLNVLYENLDHLTHAHNISSLMPDISAIELEEITNFFKSFEIVAFLQSGMNQKSSFALTQFTPQNKLISILTTPKEQGGKSPYENLIFLLNSDSDVKDLFLNMYTEKFGRANSIHGENRSKRVRGKNYNVGMSFTDSRTISKASKNIMSDVVKNPLFEIGAGVATSDVKPVDYSEKNIFTVKSEDGKVKADISTQFIGYGTPYTEEAGEHANTGNYNSDDVIFASVPNAGTTTTQVDVLSPSEVTNHSGGAYGGDTFWDVIGRVFGVTDHKHYKDEGNQGLSKKLKDSSVQATVLTKQQMDVARDQVEKLTGIRYGDTLTGNLQVRNYYQVVNSDGVFAVATIKDSSNVKGGTNTAVQLGIKMGKPVYVWDTTTKQWYKSENNIWVKTDTPTLTKNFAGVGSRDIESYNVKNKKTGKWEQRKEYLGAEVEKAAKQAIRDVYKKTFVQPTGKVFKGGMTFKYDNNKRDDVKADTTFDAILSGERIATTRYSDHDSFDYWKDVKAGDTITWKSADGRTVDVIVTKALHPLKGSGKTIKDWSKLEGWSTKYFNDKVKGKIDKAWQIEYKLPESQITRGDVKVVSEDYGVVQVETNPIKDKKERFLNIIRPQIQAQTYKENVGKGANQMFHYGLMWSRVNAKSKPIKIKSFAPVGNRNKLIDAGQNAKGNTLGINEYTYAYHELDQNGNPLPSMSTLQPIIDEISQSLGIDMSDYDSLIGNIYQPGEFIYPHKDVTESKSAEKYPVIVYTIGANAGLGIVDNNKGKMTFANQYDDKYLRGDEKLKGYTNEVLTKDGTIYTFGMGGKGRFQLTHSTPINDAKKGDQPPITLPNGQVITNYTITLTFRRSADLTKGVPEEPARFQPAVQKSNPEQVRSIKEVFKALDAGSTIITDSKSDVEANPENDGEARLLKNLEAKGYFYNEMVIDGKILGVWRKKASGNYTTSFNTEGMAQGSAKKLVESNPDKYYVYGLATENVNNATEGDAIFHNAGVNTIGIPVKLDYSKGEGAERPDLFRDLKVQGYGDLTTNTIDPDIKDAIDDAIYDMLYKQSEGYVLMFNQDGYGQEMIQKTTNKKGYYAPQTFLYLSEQLFENFGYLNPGYLRTASGGEFIQKTRVEKGQQTVTDLEIARRKEKEIMELSPEDVVDFMIKC